MEFPKRFRDIVSSRPDQLAVKTLAGQTLCIDARWQDEARDVTLSAEGRFFAFGWVGYEAWGYTLIDRTGAGRIFEMGSRPVASPSAKRLASIEATELEFEAFRGLKVLEIEAKQTREIGTFEALPDDLTEWTITNWHGEDCLEISAVRYQDWPQDGQLTSTTPRRRFIAREDRNWAVEPLDSCPT